MVKIAIAGGSSNVALEVIDVLCAANKHKILLLSRKDIPAIEHRPGVSWAQVDYTDINGLSKALSSVHTLFSFIVTQSDPGCVSQKNLVQAAIKAGVKRFAPSEWTVSSLEHMPWYAGKEEMRRYLMEVNNHEQILQYCLFQPGLFTNYFTHPYKSAKHFTSFQTHIDFENCRALVVGGGEGARMALTTVQDFAEVVAKAVDYDRQWPVTGGIKGTEISVRRLIAIGEDVRGRKFAVERLSADDIRAGVIKSSWLPAVEHSGVQGQDVQGMMSGLVAGMLLATSAGTLDVSDEWNKLLPEFQFVQAREFLEEAWKNEK